MRQPPIWYLVPGILLGPLLFFLLVTPIFSPMYQARTVPDTTDTHPLLVMVRYAYRDYGPALSLTTNGELILGDPDSLVGRRFSRGLLTSQQLSEFLRSLDPSSLVHLAGTHIRYGASHAPETVLILWHNRVPFIIRIIGDSLSDLELSPIQPRLDSVLSLVRTLGATPREPWTTSDSTLVLWEVPKSGVPRPWPAIYPSPAYRRGSLYRVPLPAPTSHYVSAFIRSLHPTEQLELYGRRYDPFLKVRLPSQEFWEW